MAKVKIITGAYNSGKTTAAEKILSDCLNAGQRAAGIIAEAEYLDGEKAAYFIRDIATRRRVPAVSAVEIPDKGWIRYSFSRFYFFEEAFRFIDGIIDGQVLALPPQNRPDIVIMDELGPLELSGGGCFPAAARLLNGFRGTVYLVIRENLIDQICEKLGLVPEDTEIIRPSR